MADSTRILLDAGDSFLNLSREDVDRLLTALERIATCLQEANLRSTPPPRR
jgi:hypothetical protein